MMKKIIMRPAVAMIELIFALTVMGIVMLSIPNLLGMAMGSSYTSLQQEAIATASADISLLLSREWDEEDTFTEDGEPILPVSNSGDGDLKVRSGGETRVKKTIGGEDPLDATIPANLGKDGATADPNGDDDIDDISTTPTTLKQATGDSKSGSIDQTISIATTVTYISDSESGGGQEWDGSTTIDYNYPFNPTAITTGSTNIKHISTHLTSNTGMNELNKDITLFAFSCNIGGFKRERREIQ
jgi:hypothetical protein